MAKKTINTTVAANANPVKFKEECPMMNNTLTERTLNMNRVERLMYVYDNLLNITKVTNELYIKKDELATFLFDNDIIGRHLSKNEIKKIKRQELVDTLITAVDNLIKAGVITPINTVPVGDLNITKDNVPETIEEEVVQDNNNAKAKTDKLLALIKACAADNNKKGFGYTISSYMLQACILNAGAGVAKLKGHTVTDEEEHMTKKVYTWLKDNGFVKSCVYSVNEDEKVRIFMPNYPGKLDGTTVRMIPYNKSAGYTAKKITSFLVTIK